MSKSPYKRSLLPKIGFQANCQEESPYASCPSAARWLCFASARLVPAKSAAGVLDSIRHLLPTIRRMGGGKRESYTEPSIRHAKPVQNPEIQLSWTAVILPIHDALINCA